MVWVTYYCISLLYASYMCLHPYPRDSTRGTDLLVEVENDFKEEDVGKTSAKIARAAGVKHEVAEAK